MPWISTSQYFIYKAWCTKYETETFLAFECLSPD